MREAGQHSAGLPERAENGEQAQRVLAEALDAALCHALAEAQHVDEAGT